MNKKEGFTLTEITICIALIMILALLVVPNLSNMDTKTKNNIYESKIKIAKSAAYKYGKDIIDDLSTDCTEVTIGYLIDKDYISGDDEDKLSLMDPNNNESLNDKIICIYYKNGKITTEIKE